MTASGTEAKREPAATPRLREAVGGLPAYKAGKAPAPGGETFKLASNENPYPPLPGVLEAAIGAAGSFNRYPDFACSNLLEELAAAYDVPVDHIAAGTGSVGVAQQLLQVAAGPGDEVIFAWRSFEAYPILTQIAGATAVMVPLRDERHDLDAMAAAVTGRTRLIFVCTPNNPTGAVVHRDELERFLDRAPDDVLVVIDEAYTEFVRDPECVDGLELYRERPNVCVLRTFSKAYGLAGLRVGFAVAHPPVATALRACAVPFGVSCVAQAAAVASLHARPALMERVEALVAERTRVVGELRRRGIAVPDTEANFYWLRLGDRTAKFAAACEEAGVTVRPFGDEGVRVTIGEPKANDLAISLAVDYA
ncbi:MAG TPA: histidinol-phosphate transaminase [Actinocrinis sp.]|uniref:histidinol-phosphate transaminase n=1 Tax=Actinocrinis sp. TaxID=1920516 RepID=UPI002DDD2364|nr:histidinol-phosphate transaminase [Actinocrinis sp.]HEV3170167.1 histidinol-phosphate transaminase [Actinocrinis sp.]